MNDLEEIGKFWQGRVVIEKDPMSDQFNPGHVVGLASNETQVFVRVKFANGDQYNLAPGDLVAL